MISKVKRRDRSHAFPSFSLLKHLLFYDAPPLAPFFRFLFPLFFHLFQELVPIPILFYHEIQVFVAAAGEVDQDRARHAGPGDLDGVGQRVRAFNGGDDAFVP